MPFSDYFSNPGNEYNGIGDSLGPNLSAFYNSQLEKLGVPGLQRTVQTFKDQTGAVNNQLNNLSEDINARTRGSLTSQAQADRMNTVEGGVLRNQLAKLGTGAQPAIDALNTALGTADKMTGFFGQDKQSQLNILMDKIHRGQALSDREWQQASDLSKMAKQHEYNMAEKSGSGNPGMDIQGAIDSWMKMMGMGNSSGGSTGDISSFFPSNPGSSNTPAPSGNNQSSGNIPWWQSIQNLFSGSRGGRVSSQPRR